MSKMANEDNGDIINSVVAVHPTDTSLILPSYGQLPHNQLAAPTATWDLSSRDGRELLASIVTGRSLSLWELCESASVLVKVEHIAVVFRESESSARDGEIVSGPVLYMCGDGKVYVTRSPYVYRTLQAVAAVLGEPPWVPPITLRVSRATGSAKRQFLMAEYIKT